MKNENDKLTSSAYLYSDIIPISYRQHAKYGLVVGRSMFGFSRSAHVVPIHINELAAVASSYPIIFVGEEKIPVAALGLEEGSNLFVNSEGSWAEKFYVPSYIRRYPFIVAKNENAKDEMLLCFDQSSPSVTPVNPDLPFYVQEKYSEFIDKTFNSCLMLERYFSETRALAKALGDYDIFCAKTVSYTQASGEKTSAQFIAIDEEKFETLSPDEFLALRTSGALNLIYAHLFSLANWTRITDLVHRN